ncbi:MAG: hypothetical protein H7833_09750 [Magnetococcus sp. DMHC-1]|nr:hypothetical protein [Magnetococcales bacterium]
MKIVYSYRSTRIQGRIVLQGSLKMSATQCKDAMQVPNVTMTACFPGWKNYWLRSLRDILLLLLLTLAMVWGLAFCFVPDAVRSVTGLGSHASLAHDS